MLAHHSKGQSSEMGQTWRQGLEFGVRKQNEFIPCTFTFLFNPGHVNPHGMLPFTFSVNLPS